MTTPATHSIVRGAWVQVSNPIAEAAGDTTSKYRCIVLMVYTTPATVTYYVVATCKADGTPTNPMDVAIVQENRITLEPGGGTVDVDQWQPRLLFVRPRPTPPPTLLEDWVSAIVTARHNAKYVEDVNEANVPIPFLSADDFDDLIVDAEGTLYLSFDTFALRMERCIDAINAGSEPFLSLVKPPGGKRKHADSLTWSAMDRSSTEYMPHMLYPANRKMTSDTYDIIPMFSKECLSGGAASTSDNFFPEEMSAILACLADSKGGFSSINPFGRFSNTIEGTTVYVVVAEPYEEQAQQVAAAALHHYNPDGEPPRICDIRVSTAAAPAGAQLLFAFDWPFPFTLHQSTPPVGAQLDDSAAWAAADDPSKSPNAGIEATVRGTMVMNSNRVVGPQGCAVGRKQGPRKSTSKTMGGLLSGDCAAAYCNCTTALTQKYEWLHRHAHGLGGPDEICNLVCGSEDANTWMITLESFASMKSAQNEPIWIETTLLDAASNHLLDTASTDRLVAPPRLLYEISTNGTILSSTIIPLRSSYRPNQAHNAFVRQAVRMVKECTLDPIAVIAAPPPTTMKGVMYAAAATTTTLRLPRMAPPFAAAPWVARVAPPASRMAAAKAVESDLQELGDILIESFGLGGLGIHWANDGPRDMTVDERAKFIALSSTSLQTANAIDEGDATVLRLPSEGDLPEGMRAVIGQLNLWGIANCTVRSVVQSCPDGQVIHLSALYIPSAASVPLIGSLIKDDSMRFIVQRNYNELPMDVRVAVTIDLDSVFSFLPKSDSPRVVELQGTFLGVKYLRWSLMGAPIVLTCRFPLQVELGPGVVIDDFVFSVQPYSVANAAQNRVETEWAPTFTANATFRTADADDADAAVTVTVMGGRRGAGNTWFLSASIVDWMHPFGLAGISLDSANLTAEFSSSSDFSLSLTANLALPDGDLLLQGSWSAASGLELVATLDGTVDLAYLISFHRASTTTKASVVPEEGVTLKLSDCRVLLRTKGSAEQARGLFISGMAHIVDTSVALMAEFTEDGVHVTSVVSDLRVRIMDDPVVEFERVGVDMLLSKSTTTRSRLLGFAQLRPTDMDAIGLHMGTTTIAIQLQSGSGVCAAVLLTGVDFNPLAKQLPDVAPLLSCQFPEMTMSYAKAAQEIAIPDAELTTVSITRAIPVGVWVSGTVQFGLINQILGRDSTFGFAYCIAGSDARKWRFDPVPGGGEEIPSTMMNPRMGSTNGFTVAITVRGVEPKFTKEVRVFDTAMILSTGLVIGFANKTLTVDLEGAMQAVVPPPGQTTGHLAIIQITNITVNVSILPTPGALTLACSGRFGRKPDAPTATMAIKVAAVSSNDAFYLSVKSLSFRDIIDAVESMLGVSFHVPLMGDIFVNEATVCVAGAEGIDVPDVGFIQPGVLFVLDIMIGASQGIKSRLAVSPTSFECEMQLTKAITLFDILTISGFDGRSGPYYKYRWSATSGVELVIDAGVALLFMQARASLTLHMGTSGVMLHALIYAKLFGLEAILTLDKSPRGIAVTLSISDEQKRKANEEVVKKVKAAAQDMKADADRVGAAMNDVVAQYSAGLSNLRNELSDARASLLAFTDDIHGALEEQRAALVRLQDSGNTLLADAGKQYTDMFASYGNYVHDLETQLPALQHQRDTTDALVLAMAAAKDEKLHHATAVFQESVNAAQAALALANEATSSCQLALDEIKRHPVEYDRCHPKPYQRWKEKARKAQSDVDNAVREQKHTGSILKKANDTLTSSIARVDKEIQLEIDALRNNLDHINASLKAVTTKLTGLVALQDQMPAFEEALQNEAMVHSLDTRKAETKEHFDSLQQPQLAIVAQCGMDIAVAQKELDAAKAKAGATPVIQFDADNNAPCSTDTAADMAEALAPIDAYIGTVQQIVHLSRNPNLIDKLLQLQQADVVAVFGKGTFNRQVKLMEMQFARCESPNVAPLQAALRAASDAYDALDALGDGALRRHVGYIRSLLLLTPPPGAPVPEDGALLQPFALALLVSPDAEWRCLLNRDAVPPIIPSQRVAAGKCLQRATEMCQNVSEALNALALITEQHSEWVETARSIQADAQQAVLWDVWVGAVKEAVAAAQTFLQATQEVDAGQRASIQQHAEKLSDLASRPAPWSSNAMAQLFADTSDAFRRASANVLWLADALSAIARYLTDNCLPIIALGAENHAVRAIRAISNAPMRSADVLVSMLPQLSVCSAAVLTLASVRASLPPPQALAPPVISKYHAAIREGNAYSAAGLSASAKSLSNEEGVSQVSKEAADIARRVMLAQDIVDAQAKAERSDAVLLAVNERLALCLAATIDRGETLAALTTAPNGSSFTQDATRCIERTANAASLWTMEAVEELLGDAQKAVQTARTNGAALQAAVAAAEATNTPNLRLGGPRHKATMLSSKHTASSNQPIISTTFGRRRAGRLWALHATAKSTSPTLQSIPSRLVTSAVDGDTPPVLSMQLDEGGTSVSFGGASTALTIGTIVLATLSEGEADDGSAPAQMFTCTTVADGTALLAAVQALDHGTIAAVCVRIAIAANDHVPLELLQALRCLGSVALEPYSHQPPNEGVGPLTLGLCGIKGSAPGVARELLTTMPGTTFAVALLNGALLLPSPSLPASTSPFGRTICLSYAADSGFRVTDGVTRATFGDTAGVVVEVFGRNGAARLRRTFSQENKWLCVASFLDAVGLGSMLWFAGVMTKAEADALKSTEAAALHRLGLFDDAMLTKISELKSPADASPFSFVGGRDGLTGALRRVADHQTATPTVVADIYARIVGDRVVRLHSAGNTAGNTASIQLVDMPSATVLATADILGDPQGMKCVSFVDNPFERRSFIASTPAATSSHLLSDFFSTTAACTVNDFNTYADTAHSDRLADWIEGMAFGTLVFMVVRDDAAHRLNERACRAIESLGSAMIRNLKFRSSWCIAGVKGASRGAVPEDLQHGNTSATLTCTIAALRAAVKVPVPAPRVAPWAPPSAPPALVLQSHGKKQSNPSSVAYGSALVTSTDRGRMLVVIDPYSGAIRLVGTFDVFNSSDARSQCDAALDAMPIGTWFGIVGLSCVVGVVGCPSLVAQQYFGGDGGTLSVEPHACIRASMMTKLGVAVVSTSVFEGLPPKKPSGGGAVKGCGLTLMAFNPLRFALANNDGIATVYAMATLTPDTDDVVLDFIASFPVGTIVCAYAVDLAKVSLGETARGAIAGLGSQNINTHKDHVPWVFCGVVGWNLCRGPDWIVTDDVVTSGQEGAPCNPAPLAAYALQLARYQGSADLVTSMSASFVSMQCGRYPPWKIDAPKGVVVTTLRGSDGAPQRGTASAVVFTGKSSSARLLEHLRSIPTNVRALIGAGTDADALLSADVRQELCAFGSRRIFEATAASTWCMHGCRGALPGTVEECLIRSDGMGTAAACSEVVVLGGAEMRSSIALNDAVMSLSTHFTGEADVRRRAAATITAVTNQIASLKVRKSSAEAALKRLATQLADALNAIDASATPEYRASVAQAAAHARQQLAVVSDELSSIVSDLSVAVVAQDYAHDHADQLAIAVDAGMASIVDLQDPQKSTAQARVARSQTALDAYLLSDLAQSAQQASRSIQKAACNGAAAAAIFADAMKKNQVTFGEIAASGLWSTNGDVEVDVDAKIKFSIRIDLGLFGHLRVDIPKFQLVFHVKLSELAQQLVEEAFKAFWKAIQDALKCIF